ncbi:MAG: ornithine carbamoyltransferase [Ilumatobacteraceae bacterium]
MNNTTSPRNFLEITDLSAVELNHVLDLASQPVTSLGSPLSGRGVALIFEKPSNRTRHSMEMAVVQLGGHPVYTRGEEIGFDVRETVEDVTRVLSGYHAILAARVFDHSTVQRMAAVATVPVVNMLSNTAHPLQTLADVLTMRQELGELTGKTVTYIGDYNNVARSLVQACALLGMHVRLGCPAGYDAATTELEQLIDLGAPSVEQYREVKVAAKGAHAVHTDVWTSMGQEDESQQREIAFARYQVTTDVMACADSAAIFMHCLPAHRGYEVEAAVIDGQASRVVLQAHNRMHSARGLLAFILEVTA